MSKHSIVRWIKIIGVYLLVAAVAALGWLWCALPEEVYLEPEQTPAVIVRAMWLFISSTARYPAVMSTPAAA